MKKFKFAVFALLVAAAFASCANPNKVHLLSVEGVAMKGLSGLELTARVDNQTCHNIHVQQGRLTLKDQGNVVAEIVLAQNVVVRRRSEQDVMLPFSLALPNPLALITLPARIKRGGGDLTVSGEVRVRAGLFMRKTYTLDPTALSDLLTQMGVSTDEITKYLKM